ncbi:MAG: TfoX/Sxy family protein [Rhizobiales bacterium]|nr:TfoX/Sxy family protein [Hyphomicrobiales bacterium]
MATSDEFAQWIVDQLSEFADVQTKRLFGGRAVLKDNLNFGLIFEDQLYLKVDDQTLANFHELDSQQFTYDKGGKTIYVSFWTIPENIIEDKEEFAEWARKAFDAALRAKKPKVKKK